MVNTKVTLCGIEMDNPIIPASGTFGFGYELVKPWLVNLSRVYRQLDSCIRIQLRQPLWYRCRCFRIET